MVIYSVKVYAHEQVDYPLQEDSKNVQLCKLKDGGSIPDHFTKEMLGNWQPKQTANLWYEI